MFVELRIGDLISKDEVIYKVSSRINEGSLLELYYEKGFRHINETDFAQENFIVLKQDGENLNYLCS